MFKKVFVFFLSLILISFFANISLAKDNTQDLPEVDGTYDVPGQPHLKLKVIVHKGKPVKPSPTPAPTCNVSDPDSLAQDATTGWHLPSNWTYSLSMNSAPTGVRFNLPLIAQNSFTVWSTNTGGLVNFTQGADTSITKAAFDGKNIIAWNKITPSALAVTYTWFYVTSGLVVENDTIMNKIYLWSWTPYSLNACVEPNSFDAEDILTHEIGHWMGLNDAYDISFADNTMYGYGNSGEIKKDTLTTGDIAGLKKIYY